MRAACSAPPQATATGNAVADPSTASGRASYGGLAETSDSHHRLAITREMREFQVQLGLGIQRPSQTTTTEAQAREAAASVGAVLVVSQVASSAAAQGLAASAARTPWERRLADASRITDATPKAGAASRSRAIPSAPRNSPGTTAPSIHAATPSRVSPIPSASFPAGSSSVSSRSTSQAQPAIPIAMAAPTWPIHGTGATARRRAAPPASRPMVRRRGRSTSPRANGSTANPAATSGNPSASSGAFCDAGMHRSATVKSAAPAAKIRPAMNQGREPRPEPAATRTAAAYAASIGAVPWPVLVTNGATAAPPNPTHQSGSSASVRANAPSATDAKAEKASASGAGTRSSDGPAAQAHTCTAARASASRLSPNERERGRSLKPPTAIAAAATSPSATRTVGPSRPCAIAQLTKVPMAASASRVARPSIPYRPTKVSRSSDGVVTGAGGGRGAASWIGAAGGCGRGGASRRASTIAGGAGEILAIALQIPRDQADELAGHGEKVVRAVPSRAQLLVKGARQDPGGYRSVRGHGRGVFDLTLFRHGAPRRIRCRSNAILLPLPFVGRLPSGTGSRHRARAGRLRRSGLPARRFRRMRARAAG